VVFFGFPRGEIQKIPPLISLSRARKAGETKLKIIYYTLFLLSDNYKTN